MHLGISEEDVNESLPGSLSELLPGQYAACMAIYMRLPTSGLLPQYIPSVLVACSAHSGKDLVRSVTETLKSLIAMEDATPVLSIPTLQSLHSRGDISDSQLMSEYVSAGYPYAMIVQLLARYHNLRMSMRTFKNRLRAFGIQRRLNPATPDTVYGTASRSNSKPLPPTLGIARCTGY